MNGKAIEAQMAQCLAKLEIARNFTGLSHNNVENHLKHLRFPTELKEHRRISFDASFRRHFTRLEKSIHGTKKDAQKYLTAKTREKDLGVFVEPASMPLNEYLDRWLEEIAKNKLRERTFDNYESLLNCHVIPFPDRVCAIM